MLSILVVPRISIFNVTVFENVGTVVIPINRTGGDLSRNTVIRASSRDVTANSSGEKKKLIALFNLLTSTKIKHFSWSRTRLCSSIQLPCQMAS